MKQVAIIGADFAPSSLPPALRLRFFAKYLPEFGWNPIIVTTDPTYYECAVDPENNKLVPASLEVIRTRAVPARWTRRLGFGDLGLRSLWHQWKAVKSICQKRKIDLIFIPVPPSVSMVLGRLMHARQGMPYVIDYIDPWTSDHYWRLPTRQRSPKYALAYAMARILEPFALRRVSAIVGVSKGTTDSVARRYPWLGTVPTSEIPYGGEASDFDYLIQHPRRNPVFDPSDGRIHVSYVGACIPQMFATVRALFSAVRRGIDQDPELFGRLRLHFVGSSYAPAGKALPQILDLAAEAGIERLVQEQPLRLPYLDALQVMVDSHALLLIGSDAPHYTASKLFPCILARRPFLAIFHEASSVVTIARETAAGRVVTFGPACPPHSRVESIYRELTDVLKLRIQLAPSACLDRFEPYTARSMAARLARTFDAVEKKHSDYHSS